MNLDVGRVVFGQKDTSVRPQLRRVVECPPAQIRGSTFEGIEDLRVVNIPFSPGVSPRI